MAELANHTAEILEQSLCAVAEAGEDITPHFFTRFFARHPEQQALFFQPRVSCGAMVNEILDSLLGLAAHEGWVNSSIHNLVIAHRCYGDFPPSLYAELLDVFVDTLADLAGERWNAGYDAAWRQLAAELHKLIVSAH
ncbi:MAG: globin [Novosphingobium sp.]